MKLENSKVFVTGAGGFIGSHLCSELVNLGASVTAMLHYNSRSDWSNLEFLPEEVKNDIKVVKGNVEDSSFMDSATKDQNIIFHLAALIGIPYSYEAPLSYVRTNIEGTINVLESGRKNDTELIINTSTSEVYGTALYTPINEIHPKQAQSPYSATKISADNLAESYFNSFELPVITVRPFNTFGPRQSARAVIPTIISQLIKNDKLKLGELGAVRDFTYVDDTVRGFLKCVEHDNNLGEVFNLGYGKAATIEETAKIIMKLMNIDKPIVSDHQRIRPKDSEVFELISDNSKALNLIDWEPKVDFSSGLQMTIDFVEKNLDFYKTNSYNI